MSERTRRVAPFATAALVALTLAACGEDPAPTDGATATPTSSTASTTSSAASSSSAPGTSTTTDEAAGPEQRQLTQQEVTAALPSRDQAPRTYVRDPRGDEEPESDWTPQADPEDCLALYQQTSEQRAFRDEHSVAHDRVRYTRDDGRRPAPSLVVSIRSYDEPYPQEFFDEAGAALAECGEHMYLGSSEASKEDWHATSIPTPTVGQQSFGVRIGRPEIGLAWDYLWVRSGHNVVVVSISTTYEVGNDKRLATYAQLALDDMKQ